MAVNLSDPLAVTVSLRSLSVTHQDQGRLEVDEARISQLRLLGVWRTTTRSRETSQGSSNPILNRHQPLPRGHERTVRTEGRLRNEITRHVFAAGLEGKTTMSKFSHGSS